MKKYRLLKDLVYIKAGAIYLENIVGESLFNYRSESVLNRYGTYDYLHKKDVENNPEWFEEVKEEPKTKFKIGDYVVCSDYSKDKIIFGKIVAYDRFDKTYNIGTGWWYMSDNFRLPTQEELKKYFR